MRACVDTGRHFQYVLVCESSARSFSTCRFSLCEKLVHLMPPALSVGHHLRLSDGQIEDGQMVRSPTYNGLVHVSRNALAGFAASYLACEVGLETLDDEDNHLSYFICTTDAPENLSVDIVNGFYKVYEGDARPSQPFCELCFVG